MKTYLIRVGTILFGAGLAVAVFFIVLRIYGSWYDNWIGYYDAEQVSDGRCNIAVIPLAGDITSYDGDTYTRLDFEDSGLVSADHVLEDIEAAESDPYIEGILLQIDSYGGEPVASEMIMEELRRSELPVAALIRDSGASGAYLAATGADIIFASRFSGVGSIGVTMSYLDNSQQNTQQGLEYVELASAKYKDYGTPDRPLRSEERKLLERDIRVWHDVFVEQVARNRNMALEAVQALADGSSMPGDLALAAGLIDRIGDMESTKGWFAEQLETPAENISFCNKSGV